MADETAGVGVGMLEVARMERALGRPGFAERVFTEGERAWCQAAPLPAEHYAACFAARGAVGRALGLGEGPRLGLRDVTVAVDEAGGAHAVLAGAAARAAKEGGVREVALSLSFTREVAVANAVAVTDGARPRPEARTSPADELAASFRRARTVLDELDRLQADMADVPQGATPSSSQEGAAGVDGTEGAGIPPLGQG